MSFHKSYFAQLSYLPALMLSVTWLVSGCSGASESASSTSQTPIVSSNTGAGTHSDASNDIDNNASNDATNTADAALDTDQAGSDMTDAVMNDTVMSNPTGADPLIQNTIPVTFEITVPAYQSNELRVALVWGDVTLNASWVGDELWSVSSELPTESENLLTITFYDFNGDIELGEVSQAFRTGSNATEPVQITADQFDVDQFDADKDGVNNLEEMILGTDPLFNEDSLLEIHASINISSTLFVSHSLERLIPDTRPIVIEEREFIPYSDDEPSEGTSLYTGIDIDADGNGTLSDTSWEVYFNRKLNGTRTNTEGSIVWEGTLTTYDGDYGRSLDFTNEVIVVDDSTRELFQVFSEQYSGYYSDSWSSTSDLTGELIEGSTVCTPVAGSISKRHWTNRSHYSEGGAITTTTVSKEVDDAYWRVVTVNPDNETTEYFAREVTMGPNGGSTDVDTSTFICDFVDID